MSDQPPSHADDDADREAVADAIRTVWMGDHSAEYMADAVLRVLSERGRLRDADYDWRRRFDAMDRQYRATIATLTRERDEALAKLDGLLRTPQWIAHAERDAAIARAEKAESERADFHLAYRTDCDRISKASLIERDAAQAEAARLREALHEVSSACDTGTLSDQLAANVRRIRAALAPAAEAPTKAEGPTDA